MDQESKSTHKGGCFFGGVYAPFFLFKCQVRVTEGDSGLCCCVCVTSLGH